MRALLLVVCASAGTAGFALSMPGCSSADDVAPGAPDAAEAGLRDVALDAAEAEAPCDPNADLFARVHDAAIGDGASTTGICLTCAKRECSASIAKCTAHCPCQGILGRAAECYLTTQKLGCAGELTSILVSPETRNDALAVLGCVQEQCPVECVVDAGSSADAEADADPDAR